MLLVRALKTNRILMAINALLLTFLMGFIGWGWMQKSSGDVIEASQIILRGESGVPSMILQGDDENTLLTLNDKAGNVRLQLQGGELPALIMKNEQREIIGTFFSLQDGGSAVGLGDAEGNMATFIRGGNSPTMSFYEKSNQPNLAMGISNHLPHFVMFPIAEKGGIFIHGNAPTSLFFIDENGEIPVSLSRHGLFQEKTKEGEALEQDGKVFSFWENLPKIRQN